MMPDPILREDTRLFARFTLSLLLMVLALLLLYLVAAELARLLFSKAVGSHHEVFPGLKEWHEPDVRLVVQPLLE